MFVFDIGPDQPVGQSARDGQLSWPRCEAAVAAAVDCTAPLRVTMRMGPRDASVQVPVELTFRWAGVDPAHPRCSVSAALQARSTVTVRGRVEMRASAGDVRDAQHGHLDVPLIIGARDTADGTPPETSFLVVGGVRFVLRNHERAAFGHWRTSSNKKRGACVVMVCPPRAAGAQAFTMRLSVPAAGRVGLYARRGTYEYHVFPLGAVLSLLGEAGWAAFAARAGGSAAAALAGAEWPGSHQEASAALMDAAGGAGAGVTPSDVLAAWVLPHVSAAGSKLNALAHGFALLLGGVEDNQDHQRGKRVDAPGDMLAACVGFQWQHSVSMLATELARPTGAGEPAPADAAAAAAAAVRAALTAGSKALDRASEDVRHAFVMQGWPGTNGMPVNGASERVRMLNAAAPLTLTRRTFTVTTDGGSRVRVRRMPHGSAHGLFDSTEISSDDSMGLGKALSMTARTSDPCPSLWDWLPTPSAACGAPGASDDDYGLVVLGLRVGRIADPRAYCAAFRGARLGALRGALPADAFGIAGVTCWVRDDVREVAVSADAGRLVRPLLVAGRVLPRFEWADAPGAGAAGAAGAVVLPCSMRQLLCEGLAEYVDGGAVDDEAFWVASDAADAAARAPAASTPPSHVELHPALYLGMMAASIPDMNSNQPTRNTFYAGSQGKQGIGSPDHGWLSQTSTGATVLLGAQKPLVVSAAGAATRQDTHPAGVNVMLLVSFHEGFNQEDALVMNRSSVQLGAFHTLHLEAHVADHGCSEPSDAAPVAAGVAPPPPRLDGDGTLPLLARVAPRSVVAHDAKVGPVHFGMRSEAAVEAVGLEAGGPLGDARRVWVRTADYRVPEVGDKFSSRHGQKGLLGLLEDPWRLPFAKDGSVPDAIINPHSLPSRMSVAQQLEQAAARLSVVIGRRVDATPFRDMTADGSRAELLRALRAAGADVDCACVMYDPVTCEPLPGRYWCAAVFMSRSQHQVRDKLTVQSAATGGIDGRTGQATKGFNKGGGLRFGEMEQDCLILWGMAFMIHEFYLSHSDGTVTPFCRACGLMATELPARDGERRRRRRCISCATKAAREGRLYVPDVAMTYIGRSTILVMLTLSAMGIMLRPTFEAREPEEQ